jgi:hypothetical protein
MEMGRHLSGMNGVMNDNFHGKNQIIGNYGQN